MLLCQRGTPSRRPGRFSSAPISNVPASDVHPTTVSCRQQSRTFLADRSGSSPRLPRIAGRTVPLQGAETQPWHCHNNLYCFSFPASASSFPVAQQKQPVFIKMFKKQAKKKEPLSGSKGKILSLYDFNLVFDVPIRYFVGTSKNTWEISDISRFLMCFGSFRTDVPGSRRILAAPLFHVFWFRAETLRPPACQFRGFSQMRGRRSSCGFSTVK